MVIKVVVDLVIKVAVATVRLFVLVICNFEIWIQNYAGDRLVLVCNTRSISRGVILRVFHKISVQSHAQKF